MEIKDQPGIPTSENSLTFHQGMVDRMGVSFYKYGRVAEGYPSRVDAIGSLKLRLQKYEDTGNTEFLMDIANFAMIEFMRPRHPKAYFKETDSKESPGRVNTAGIQSQESNTAAHENVRLGGSKIKTSGGFYKREGD